MKINSVEPDIVTQHLAASFAPSLGYFGATDTDWLECSIHGIISEIRLSIHESTPTFLNLQGIELLCDGKALALEQGQFSVQQSSIHGNNPANGPAQLLRKQAIHTLAEEIPWWKIQFESPLQIDSVRVLNRVDGWGCRSRLLKIEVKDQTGELRDIYRGESEGNLFRALSAALAAAGEETTYALCNMLSVRGARELRSALVHKIATKLRKGAIELSSVDWPGLVQTVNVWAATEPCEDEWTVIAAFLLAQRLVSQESSLRSFSLRLTNGGRILRLENEINAVATAYGRGQYTITRHGLNRAVLLSEPNEYIAHMGVAIRALEELGREPVIAYGTLLGAVRNGLFIPHDDDVDLLYRTSATSRKAAEEEVLELAASLRKRGMRVVSLLPESMNMHLINPQTNAVVDIFPCWESDGKLFLHMEKMKVRGIDPGLVYPRGRIEFYGEQFPAPGCAEGFLVERYGEGWQKSNQFFEWPWNLTDEDER